MLKLGNLLQGKPVLLIVLLTALLLSLPLLGLWCMGEPLGPYLRFPPQPPEPVPAGFSWTLFGLCLVLEIPGYGMLAWILHHCRLVFTSTHSFPHWGWVALGWLLIVWYCAWTRPEWLGIWADFSFTFLWLGYIFVINALCVFRQGWSLLTHHPRFLLGLFPLSALFWWYFEYLNRFVGNWQYLGVENLGPWEYFWRATLPFSTILPAVISTLALLRGFFGPCEGLPSLNPRHPKAWASIGLTLGCVGLAGVGIWPQWFFALLWVAPLILFVSIQVLLGEPSYFRCLGQGRWDRIALPMLAALICGFFWEMWNFWSDPKWVYHVPWVGRFKIFEMPILGYAGYLPFGLECAVVADWWARRCGSFPTTLKSP